MANDEERLIVLLEARVTDLEKGMKRADKTTTATFNKMRRGSKRATDQMASDMTRGAQRVNQALATIGTNIGTFGKAFAAGLAGGAVTAAFSVVTSNLRETVKGVAELGDEAKKSGLSAKSFQEWKFVAEQNRVSLDALTDGFKELNLRADEWIKTGSGSGAESFKRLGFTAEDLAERLKDPSALMLEIIDRLQALDQAARIRIMDELFGGTGGEQFVQLIDRGRAGLQKTIQTAHEVGAVLDENMIEKAQEIDRRFDELGTRVSNWLKTLAVEIADLPFDVVQTRIEELFSDENVGRSILGDAAYEELRKFGALTEDQVQDVETLRDRYSALTDAAQAMAVELAGAASTADMLGNDDLWQVLAEASNEMRALSEQFAKGSITGEEFASKMEGIRKKAAEALAQLDGIDRQQFSGVIASLGGLGNKLLDLIGKAKELKATLPGTANATTGKGLTVDQIDLPGTSNAPTTSVRPTAAPAMVSENVDDGSSKSGGKTSNRKTAADMLAEISQETAALQAQAKAFAEVTGTMDDYETAMDYASTKAKLLTALQQEGIKVTPELAAKVDQVAQAYANAAQQADDAREKLHQMQNEADRGKDAIGGIFGEMLDGADAAKQAIADLLMQIAKVQFAKGAVGLLGGTSWGSDLISLVGSGLTFASGGYTGAGGKYQPAGTVHKGEYVFSKAATSRIGVGNLDAMHQAAKRGYAEGGYVGGSVGGSATKVDVTVAFDESGNLYVKQVAQQEAQSASASAVHKYDKSVLRGRLQSFSKSPRTSW